MKSTKKETDFERVSTRPTRGTIRRVNFSDYKAIMDINDNVYHGVDYLPVMFNIFLQSKEHEMYVAEEDGKPVYFVNYLLQPDDDSLTTAMSGRVLSNYEGQGHVASVTLALAKNHPKLTGQFFSTLLKPKIQAKFHKCKVCYISNYILYFLDDRPKLQRFVRLNRSASEPTRVSFSESLRWLHCSDRLLSFVAKYSPEFIPLGAPSTTIRVNRKGLRRVFSDSQVFATFGEPVFGHIKTGVTSPEREVIGLSYSTCVPCKIGLKVDINFYGDDCDVFVGHFVCQLRHYVNMTDDDVTIACALHFPLAIQVGDVEQRLKDEIGSRFESEALSVTQMAHYIAPIPRPKL